MDDKKNTVSIRETCEIFEGFGCFFCLFRNGPPAGGGVVAEDILEAFGRL